MSDPSKRSDIDPFIVMDVMRAAAERADAVGDVLHLEVGQPGTSAPRAVLDAAAQALENDLLGYTAALGMPELRQRISRHYRQVYGIDIPAERIIVTTGSSGGFVLAFLAAFDVGARVALTSPGYPCYRQIMRVLGIESVAIETSAEKRWVPDPDDLEKAGPLDGVIIASPANPTGAMLSGAEISSLAAKAQQMGALYISDEIYHGLTYGAPARTALEFSDDVIVINSFSKYYCMTGWRIGWMVVPERFMRPLERLAQNLFISTPTISQHAAIAAFDATDDLEAIKDVYAANREILLEELPRAGLTGIVPPEGAFYFYADVSKFTNNSYEFTRKMLDETGVAATPGLDFDPGNGRHFIRFSFAGQTEEIKKAARRLQDWLS